MEPGVLFEPKKKQQFFETRTQRLRRSGKSVIEEKRIQLIDEERFRMKETGDLRLSFYKKEHGAHMEEIKQRKECHLALHQKQMQFWDEAAKRIKCCGTKNEAESFACEVLNLIDNSNISSE